jgi:hypothetical protein
MIGLLWLGREEFRRPGTDPPFSELECHSFAQITEHRLQSTHYSLKWNNHAPWMGLTAMKG